MLELRLYVNGQTPENDCIAAALERALTAKRVAHHIDFMDIFEHPVEALEDAVFVTPTLVRRSPPPTARVIGNLSDSGRVLNDLGIA